MTRVYDDFPDMDDLIIQPKDANVEVWFEFPFCSSFTANDGAIPYGSTISDISVESLKGDTVITDMIQTTTFMTPNQVGVKYSYPSVNGTGKYRWEFTVTLTGGTAIEFDFLRIEAKNIK